MFHRISQDIDELWPSLKPHQFPNGKLIKFQPFENL